VQYLYQDQILYYLSYIDWGQLPDYLIVITTTAIAYFVYEADNKRANESQVFERELNKPLIGFSNKSSKDYYSIHNYGKGAALNIITAYKSEEKNNEWQKYVNCYSLKEGESIDLFWKDGGYEWIVKYEDSFGQKFISTCKHDTVSVLKVTDKNNHLFVEFLQFIDDNLGDIKKIDRYWNLNKK
jgi:hypothetical protein